MLRLAQSVDQPPHLVQRAGTAEMIPIAGQRRNSRGTRFLLHDQRAFDAGLHAVKLVLFDALGQTRRVRQGDVNVCWARSAPVPA